MLKDSALAAFIKRYPVLKGAAVFLMYVVAQFHKHATLWMLVAVVFVMRPVWRFRFARIRSEKLGHFISETDLALALIGEPEFQKTRSTNIFLLPSEACNEQLRKMYLRAVPTAPNVQVLDCRSSHIARLLFPAVNELTLRAQTEGKLWSLFCGSPTSMGMTHVGLLYPRGPRLSFTSEEIDDGWRICAQLGLSPKTRYVCIHIRDSAFLRGSYPERDWTYHDYRNPGFSSYLRVVHELLDKGFWVVRMGRMAQEALPVEHPHFIDYPFSGQQSDFLDVFLYAHAVLGIAGGASGIDQLGYAFDVPGVVTDLIPFEPFMPVRHLHVLPTLLRFRASKKILNLKEMLEHSYFTSNSYEQQGIDLERNTSQEICEVVDQALARLESDTRLTLDRREEMFWAEAQRLGLFDRARIGPPESIYANPSIGRAFLDAHWNDLMAH